MLKSIGLQTGSKGIQRIGFCFRDGDDIRKINVWLPEQSYLLLLTKRLVSLSVSRSAYVRQWEVAAWKVDRL